MTEVSRILDRAGPAAGAASSGRGGAVRSPQVAPGHSLDIYSNTPYDPCWAARPRKGALPGLSASYKPGGPGRARAKRCSMDMPDIREALSYHFCTPSIPGDYETGFPAIASFLRGVGSVLELFPPPGRFDA